MWSNYYTKFKLRHFSPTPKVTNPKNTGSSEFTSSNASVKRFHVITLNGVHVLLGFLRVVKGVS